MAMDDNNDEDSSSSPYYLHITLALLATISFWAQSVVTEERLVPALHVLADYYKIPDDVAGATLMAAGASSPELLCTLVSLFVTRSSLGLGTIVGSEIFNQLVICAGSVYATKSKVLVLDRRMVVREVGFYGLSIGLLYIALSESRVANNDNGEERNNNGQNENGKGYIYVSFWKALLLFGGYILYVLVCANMGFVEMCIQRFMNCFGRGEQHDGSNDKDEEDVQECDFPIHAIDVAASGDSSAHQTMTKSTSLASIHYKSFDDHELHQLPFIYNITTEPVENWDNISPSNESDDILISSSSLASEEGGNDANSFDAQRINIKKKKRGLISAAIHKSFKLIKANHILCRDDYPVEINDVYELTNNEGSHEIGCFLWQRSMFYTKAYFGSHAFHLRWFTITLRKVASVPDRQEPEKHAIVYPLFREVLVDKRRLIINIVHPVEGRQGFILMAPSRAIFDAVVKGLEEYMAATQALREQGMIELDDWGDGAAEGDGKNTTAQKRRDIDADPHVDLIELPQNASKFELALWVSVYPLRLIMHYTLPELRHLDHHGQRVTKSISRAYLSTFSCLVWLIAGSYVMVYSLEHLGALLGIPDTVMGVTISAAGTSLPAYIASRIAAEKGFGNQAVANVFGSNTFNICVGLGLPWVIYVISSGFDPYHDLENEGILDSILILAGTLFVFAVLMVSSNFVLLRWHANLFLWLYTVYIIYAVGHVYL